MARSKAIDLICNEPYRLFFPLGVLIGMLGTSHWLLYALGWTQSYSGFFHASIFHVFQLRILAELCYMGWFAALMVFAARRFKGRSKNVTPPVDFVWLPVAAAVWIFAGASWLAFILPRISRVLSKEEFERCHEEAKERLMRFRPT